MGGESVRAFSSHGFLYVFIFIMEKKETFVYNERNKNNEVKLDDERKGRSMYLYKKEVRKFVKGRFIVGKGT